jgi:hypothetical protein
MRCTEETNDSNYFVYSIISMFILLVLGLLIYYRKKFFFDDSNKLDEVELDKGKSIEELIDDYFKVCTDGLKIRLMYNDFLKREIEYNELNDDFRKNFDNFIKDFKDFNKIDIMLKEDILSSFKIDSTKLNEEETKENINTLKKRLKKMIITKKNEKIQVIQFVINSKIHMENNTDKDLIENVRNLVFRYNINEYKKHNPSK